MGKWQVVKTDENGREKVIGRADTSKKAREIADAERAQRLRGSSEAFGVREAGRIKRK